MARVHLAGVYAPLHGLACRQSAFPSAKRLTSTTLCQVFTVDHEEGGRLRRDVAFRWDDPSDPASLVPDDEIVCDPFAGFVCARDACSALWLDNVRWWTTGPGPLLAAQDGMLLEYDCATFAPTGAFRPQPIALPTARTALPV